MFQSTKDIKEENKQPINIIRDTKQRIEPPKYTTNLNTVYNPQTYNPQTYNTLPVNNPQTYNTINKPAPAPAPSQNLFRENQLRQLMGIKQIERPRYEPLKQEIRYTSGNPILDRLLNN